MEVEETFDLLFKDWDFENSNSILPLVRKCISVSPGEKELLRALEIALCFCLKNFSTDKLEEELFQTVCPAARNMALDKLKYLEKNPTGCVESLDVCFKLISFFQEVFVHLNESDKIAFIEVKNLLIATSEILFSCFYHCKISEKVYDTLFSSVTNYLTNFFKKSCSLLEQLLNFLTEKVDCNIVDDRDILLLNEILVFLSKSGIVLINLELKTMAKVWKAFIFFVEKHIHFLKNNFNIGETIKNLCCTIEVNMETALHKDNEDFVKIIKLNCFLLKLVVKFLEVFSGYFKNCQNFLLNLLLLLARCDASLGTEAKLKKNLNQDLLNQLTIGTDPLVSHLMTDKEFIKECHMICTDTEKSAAFSLLCCSILKKLLDSSSATRELWFNENENILEWIFLSASSSHFITSMNIALPNILVNAKQKKFTDLYEYVLVVTSAFLMTATAYEYRLVEKSLIHNVLQTDPIRALLAVDMWCLLARFADSELCLAQILTLSKIFQEFHSKTLRVEKWYLGSLIRRLFPLLVGSHKGVFLKSFQHSFYSALWEGSGVYDCTLNETTEIYRDFVAQVSQFFDQNEAEPSNFEFEKPIECQNLTYEKFKNIIFKLWKFDCEILSSTCQNVWFLKRVCAMTASVVSKMPSEHLLLVLTQMKSLLIIGQPSCVKLYFTWILNSLSTVSIPPGNPQKKILSTIAEIFQNLLLSNEVIVKEKAFETFYYFSHVTFHGEVIPLSVQNAPELKQEITTYFKKIPPVETEFNLNDYGRELYKLKFEHVCEDGKPDDLVIPKKIKLLPVDLQEIMVRWKDDSEKIVESFQYLSESQKREMKNVCNFILSLPE